MISDRIDVQKKLGSMFPGLRGAALRNAILASIAGPGAKDLTRFQVFKLLRHLGYDILDATEKAERLAIAYDADGDGRAGASEIDALIKDAGLSE